MNDNGETILLCLVNNDPCSTIFMTSAGQPLYSVTTPNARPPKLPRRTSLSEKHRGPLTAEAVVQHSLEHPNPPPSLGPDGLLHENASSPDDSESPPLNKECHVRRGSETFVRRVVGCDVTTGHVESTIGVITEAEDETVKLELPTERGFSLAIPHIPRRMKPLLEGTSPVGSITDGAWSSNGELEEVEEEGSSGIESWDFKGPDHKQYRWLMFGNSPIMTHVDQSMSYPVARYRRAKLGIVSRPRKGFLEIFPHGSVSIDLIVTTFVGFMKTCVIPAQKALPLESEHTPLLVDSSHRRASAPMPSHRPPVGSAIPSPDVEQRSTSAAPASSIPSRFQSAAALARKHSKSPPANAITFPPFAVKPRPLPSVSGLTEHT